MPTCGGPEEALPYLTPIDPRLVTLMGGLQCGVGDSHAMEKPFPATPFPPPSVCTIAHLYSESSQCIRIVPVILFLLHNGNRYFLEMRYLLYAQHYYFE